MHRRVYLAYLKFRLQKDLLKIGIGYDFRVMKIRLRLRKRLLALALINLAVRVDKSAVATFSVGYAETDEAQRLRIL